MLPLELTKEELQNMDYNSENILQLLTSRAIYNESINYNFTENQQKELQYIYDCETVKYYMFKTVEPRIVVNENTVIDEYNKNKNYFTSNNISFKDARDIILNQLNEQVNYNLEQDLIKKLVDNMPDTISLKKEDIAFSKGNPEVLKSLVIISLLNEETKSSTFLEEHKQNLETIKQNIRLNYFINAYNSENITVTEEEIKKFYEDNKDSLEGRTLEESYNDIIHHIFNTTLKYNIEQYVKNIEEKYNLKKEVEKYTKNKEN